VELFDFPKNRVESCSNWLWAFFWSHVHLVSSACWLFFYGYAGEDGCGYPEDWPKNSWEKRGVAWNEDECETIHKAVATSPAKPLFSLALAIREIGLLPRNVDEL
jgi:hypothetical protein